MPDESVNQAIIDNSPLTNPLRLSRAILVNGEMVSELPWDGDGLTVDQMGEAFNRAAASNRVMESDGALHLALGCQMVTCADPKISPEDLQRELRGPDVVRVMNLGRFFIIRSEASDEGDSDGQSAGTPGSTTPPSPRSDDGDSASSSGSTTKR